MLRHRSGLFPITLAALAATWLSACTPPEGFADAPLAEPVIEAAPPAPATAHKSVPNPCEDDDGIGGTGCQIQ